MAFSDSLTQQQKDDFLLARGMDFDTFLQRQLDEVTKNAANIRLQQLLAQVVALSPTDQATVVAQLQTSIQQAGAINVTATPITP